MRNFPKSLLTILSGIISIGIIYHTPLFQKDERQEYSEYIREHAFFPSNKHIETDKAIPQSDRPDLSWQQNYLLTMDPVLMRPAPERLEAARLLVKRKLSEASARPGDNTFPWVERGPNNVGGRTRAIVWDPTDASGKKVWAGGVSGGLWFTSDIYDAAVTWQKVNDFWDNLSISAIAVDPVNNQIMYVGTGEGWGSGASRGDGIWKSTDGGSTWTKLTSSQNFYYINDLIVRNEAGIGVVYAAVRADYYEGSWHGLSAQGLQRSTDEGITFTQVMTNIAGEGEPYAIADLELAADNTLWAGSVDNAYSLTDDGGGSILYSTNGTTWTLSTKRSGSQRVELACAPSNSNVVYALIENNGTVNEVLKTTNAGSTWINISQPNDADTDIPATDFSRGQAWYDLILAVDPTNENTVIAGAIDLFRTTNGGTSWSQLS
ncbi:MAG: hypothetical protein OEY56_09160, partial [Cyclobacteriaceae bacterium]|nr:hypothetical protein [Cyclobacteriaceae bacterium]